MRLVLGAGERCLNAECLTGADELDGAFAAVGDEDASEHRLVFAGVGVAVDELNHWLGKLLAADIFACLHLTRTAELSVVIPDLPSALFEPIDKLAFRHELAVEEPNFGLAVGQTIFIVFFAAFTSVQVKFSPKPFSFPGDQFALQADIAVEVKSSPVAVGNVLFVDAVHEDFTLFIEACPRAVFAVFGVDTVDFVKLSERKTLDGRRLFASDIFG